MTSVQLGRLLDSAVLALFIMVLSAASLLMFGHLWVLAQSPHLIKWKVGPVLKMLFPFTKRFEFNLTHVLLFSIVICCLSLGPSSTEAQKPGASKSRRTTTQTEASTAS